MTENDRTAELQREIDRLAERLDARSIPVGGPLRTTDDINIFVDDDGVYHYAYYERGTMGWENTGSFDDILYWYCQGEVSRLASFDDRRDRFLFEYQVLSHYQREWGKRFVRELAAKFRDWGKPEDIALLPDIGEPV